MEWCEGYNFYFWKLILVYECDLDYFLLKKMFVKNIYLLEIGELNYINMVFFINVFVKKYL